MSEIRRFVIKCLERQPVRYLISSCVAFLADYAATLLLNALFKGFSGFSMEIAAAISFAMSSQINFWINRRWVFKSTKSVLPELGGYYSLALCSFAIKAYVILEILVRLLKIPLAISKPISEAAMFLVNYFVQKIVIFNKRKK